MRSPVGVFYLEKMGFLSLSSHRLPLVLYLGMGPCVISPISIDAMTGVVTMQSCLGRSSVEISLSCLEDTVMGTASLLCLEDTVMGTAFLLCLEDATMGTAFLLCLEDAVMDVVASLLCLEDAVMGAASLLCLEDTVMGLISLLCLEDTVLHQVSWSSDSYFLFFN